MSMAMKSAVPSHWACRCRWAGDRITRMSPVPSEKSLATRHSRGRASIVLRTRTPCREQAKSNRKNRAGMDGFHPIPTEDLSTGHDGGRSFRAVPSLANSGMARVQAFVIHAQPEGRYSFQPTGRTSNDLDPHTLRMLSHRKEQLDARCKSQPTDGAIEGRGATAPTAGALKLRPVPPVR